MPVLAQNWISPETEDDVVISPRYGHSAVIDKARGRMILFGGVTGNEYSSEVFIYDLNYKFWRKVKPTGKIPPRYNHSAVMWGKKTMVVFGGHGMGGRLDDIWFLNTKNWSWVKISVQEDSQVPLARRHHISFMHNDHLCIFGGWDNHLKDLGDMWMINLNASPRVWFKVPFDDTWKQILIEHDLIKGRKVVQESEGEGEDGDSEKKQYEEDEEEDFGYDFGEYEDEMSSKDLITPSSRRGHSALKYNNKIYVFGGIFMTKGHKNDLHSFNLNTFKWQLEKCNGKYPSAREGHTAVLNGDDMVVFGGTPKGKIKDTMATLNLKTMTWYTENQMIWTNIPRIRCDHTMICHKQIFYMFGGEGEKLVVDSLEKDEDKKKIKEKWVGERLNDFYMSEILDDFRKKDAEQEDEEEELKYEDNTFVTASKIPKKTATFNKIGDGKTPHGYKVRLEKK